jgi:hypothetical protein
MLLHVRQLAALVSSNINVVRSRHGWSSPTAMSRCWAVAQRPLSTMAPVITQQQQQQQQQQQREEEVEPKTITIQTFDGRTFKVLDSRKLPELKPHIVKRRLARMRTYVDAKKGIRHSSWRLNLICQMIAGLSVPEALKQLQFCDKSRAPLVQEFLQAAATKAKEKDGLPNTKLEVAECFVTRGTPLKRIRYMGRGR